MMRQLQSYNTEKKRGTRTQTNRERVSKKAKSKSENKPSKRIPHCFFITF